MVSFRLLRRNAQNLGKTRTLLVFVLLIASCSAYSQEETRIKESQNTKLQAKAPELVTASPEFISSVIERNWERDPALQTRVSFTAQKQPLTEVIGQLQYQTKIKLALHPDSFANTKKLTAVASDMSLCEIMNCLSRLYGIRWDKQIDGSYLASDLNLNALEQQLLRFGEAGGWQVPEHSLGSPENASLVKSILEHTTVETLKSPQGFALSSLPLELQNQVRDEVNFHAALNLVSAYSRALLPVLGDTSVVFEEPHTPTATMTQTTNQTVASTLQNKSKQPLPESPSRLTLSDVSSKPLEVVASFTPAPKPIAPIILPKQKPRT